MFGTGIGSFGQEAKGKDGKAYPHNLFLEVGSELGFFGLLFTFLFLISVIWSAFKFLFTRKDLFVKYKGAVYVSFFLFLENLKSNSFFENKILFGAIGILLLLTQSLNEKDSELNSKK
jgi:O-antigen ligase